MSQYIRESMRVIEELIQQYLHERIRFVIVGLAGLEMVGSSIRSCIK
jgi:hypothetical protein